MKQLHIFKRLTTLALCAGLVTTGALAANSVTRMIQANYSGIHITVDGKQITPKDANGKVVEPFTVDNTTYLPVRAVAEALGKTVTWDEKTQTVYIGEVPSEEGTYLTPNEIRGGSQITDPKELPLYNSADRKTVLYLSDRIADRYAVYDLGGKYKTISFTVLLPFGGSPDETSFQFYVDGALKLTVPRSSISTPKDFELDVTGAKTLKIVKTPAYDEIANGFCVADMRAK